MTAGSRHSVMRIHRSKRFSRRDSQQASYIIGLAAKRSISCNSVGRYCRCKEVRKMSSKCLFPMSEGAPQLHPLGSLRHITELVLSSASLAAECVQREVWRRKCAGLLALIS